MQAPSDQQSAFEGLVRELLDRYRTLNQQEILLNRVGWVVMLISITCFFLSTIGSLVGILCSLVIFAKWYLIREEFTTQLNKISRVLPDLGWRSVGLVLDVIALTQAVQSTTEGDNALDQAKVMLTRYLPILPTDELVCFSCQQRQALARITRQAIEQSSRDPNQEPLAVAGLLALGTLKDRTLEEFVDYLPPEQTRRLVQAAATEYLEGLHP